MNIVETCYEILVLSYCKKKLLLKEVVLGPGTAASQTFKMFIASGWRGWCCKFEVLGIGFSAGRARRFEVRLNRPENRGMLQWSGFCSKNSLIREINASFVPSSESSNAPAISCRSDFFFELSAPVRMSSKEGINPVGTRLLFVRVKLLCPNLDCSFAKWETCGAKMLDPEHKHSFMGS